MTHHWTLTHQPSDLRKVHLPDLLGPDAGEPSSEERKPGALTLGQTPEGVESLDDARTYLERRLKEGAQCPCCGQAAGLYQWTLKPKQAAGLLLLAWFSKENPEHGQRFVHVTRFFAALGLPPRISTLLPTDFPKLRHWGLLEEGDRGFYRLTKKGFDFVSGKVSVPSTILTYNDTFLGTTGDPVNIYTLGDVLDLAAFDLAQYTAKVSAANDLASLADLETQVGGHPLESEMRQAGATASR